MAVSGPDAEDYGLNISFLGVVQSKGQGIDQKRYVIVGKMNGSSVISGSQVQALANRLGRGL